MVCTLLSLNISAAEPSLVPQPQSVAWGQGEWVLDAGTVVCHDARLAELAAYLRDRLEPSTGLTLTLQAAEAKAFQRMKLRKRTAIGLFLTEGLPREGYRLSITPQRATIEAADPAGAFYGVQTLLQLLPPEAMDARLHKRMTDGRQWTAPCATVCDAPQRPWRGLMLDVARYFHDLSYLRHYIDCMAHYKLNRLQLHLIDDSGWRLEIKKYPRLTQQGAFAGPEESRLGGYYTQQEMQDLIRYAQLRGVEIVPEVEFPAHILSAVVAYPWLSCTGEQQVLQTRHSISPELLCVGKPASLQFLRDVLDEVCDLFPCRYVNIGGDEAKYTRWEACPDCQALMRRQGLEKASQLQGWLTGQMAGYLAAKGRTAVGWQEIVERGKVDHQVVATVWSGAMGDSLKIKEMGHKVLLSPNAYLYLDFPECATPGEVPAATWRSPIPLEKVYAMPCEDYSPESACIGLQACVWSDLFIHGVGLPEFEPLAENRSEAYIDYLTFPRLLAVSEVAWCKKADRSWPRFQKALERQFRRLDCMDVHYRVPEPRCASEGGLYTLLSPVEGAEVRYTLDGSLPHEHSLLYTAPVSLAEGQTLRAITVASPGHRSLPLTVTPDAKP